MGKAYFFKARLAQDLKMQKWECNYENNGV